MHDDDLDGVQRDRRRSTSVDLSKGIVVCPLLSFYFIFLFFSFYFYFFCRLNGSFYLILILPLWYLLILSSLGSFPHFRGNTLYFTRIKEIFHTLQRYSQKENVTIMMQMYASARVAGHEMILAHHVTMIRAMPN